MSKNKTQNTLPFDVLKNQILLNKSDSDDVLGFIRETEKNFKGVVKNWFIPIITEQSMLEKILEREEREKKYSYSCGFSNDRMDMFPQSKLYVEIEGGKLTSVEVLFNKGKKLYRVISQKDYGVIKSRMELTEKGKLVPYGKCDLIPFEGEYNEWVIQKGRGYRGRNSMFLSEKLNYVDGLKDGECFTYYKTSRWDELTYFQNEYSKDKYSDSFEQTTYQKGKKNGFYVNTKRGLEGNYINDKKNGKWMVNNEFFNSELPHTDYDISNLFETYKRSGRGLYYGRSGNMDKQLIEVNYVNGLLHGDFRTLDNLYVGNCELGKMNGTFKINNLKRNEDDDEYYVESVNRVIQVKDGKIIGVDFGRIGENNHYWYGIHLRDKHGISKKIKLEERTNSHYSTFSDELINKLNYHITDETIDWIIQNTDGRFNNKEEFFKEYFVIQYREFELDERGGGREHYGYSPIKTEELSWYSLMKEFNGDDNYRWGSNFTKMLVEKFDYPYYEIDEDGDYHSTYNPHNGNSYDIERFNVPCYISNGVSELLQFGDKLYNNDDSESINSLKVEVLKRITQQLINTKKTTDKENEEREKEEERIRVIREQREIENQRIREEQEKEQMKKRKELEKKQKKLKEQQLKVEGLHITSFPTD